MFLYPWEQILSLDALFFGLKNASAFLSRSQSLWILNSILLSKNFICWKVFSIVTQVEHNLVKLTDIINLFYTQNRLHSDITFLCGIEFLVNHTYFIFQVLPSFVWLSSVANRVSFCFYELNFFVLFWITWMMSNCSVTQFCIFQKLEHMTSDFRQMYCCDGSVTFCCVEFIDGMTSPLVTINAGRWPSGEGK